MSLVISRQLQLPANKRLRVQTFSRKLLPRSSCLLGFVHMKFIPGLIIFILTWVSTVTNPTTPDETSSCAWERKVGSKLSSTRKTMFSGTQATLLAHCKAMLMQVKPECGLPYLQNVQIASLEATGAKVDIGAEDQANSPLENSLLCDAKSNGAAVGKVDQAKSWDIQNVDIKAENR